MVTLWKHLRGSQRCQSFQIFLFFGNKSQAELLHLKCTSGAFSNRQDFIDEIRGTKISDFMMVLSFSSKNRCKICSARKCYLNILCFLCSQEVEGIIHLIEVCVNGILGQYQGTLFCLLSTLEIQKQHECPKHFVAFLKRNVQKLDFEHCLRDQLQQLL